jgi:hypothetical protein
MGFVKKVLPFTPLLNNTGSQGGTIFEQTYQSGDYKHNWL